MKLNGDKYHRNMKITNKYHHFFCQTLLFLGTGRLLLRKKIRNYIINTYFLIVDYSTFSLFRVFLFFFKFSWHDFDQYWSVYGWKRYLTWFNPFLLLFDFHSWSTPSVMIYPWNVHHSWAHVLAEGKHQL